MPPKRSRPVIKISTPKGRKQRRRRSWSSDIINPPKRRRGEPGLRKAFRPEPEVPADDDVDAMNAFFNVSSAFVEVPDRHSDIEPDSEDEDNDDELRDPDDEVTKTDKGKGGRGRKRKNPPKPKKSTPKKRAASASESHSMTVAPFPLLTDGEAVASGRRSKIPEITMEIGQENTNKICCLFKDRKSLKLGKDPDSVITNKLFSIKCSPWFEKTLKHSFPVMRHHNQTGPPEEEKMLQIMWVYHTNWIVKKMSEQRKTRKEGDEDVFLSVAHGDAITPVGMDWIQKFVRYYNQYREVLRSGDSDTANELTPILKNCISMVVDISAREMTKMSLCHFDAFNGVMDWCNTINQAIEEKDALLEELELEHHALLSKPPRLDEFSIWGLKPLRKNLAPPYFKTSDVLAAAPSHPVSTAKEVTYPDAFYNLNKQKWTTKDLEALKTSIREVLIEKCLLLNTMRADVLLKDCSASHDDLMEKKMMREAMGESTDDLDDVPKRRGRPKKFGQVPYVGTIVPFLCSIPTPNGPIVVRYKTDNTQIEQWRDKQEDKVNKKSLVELLKSNPDVDWLSVSNKVTTKTKKNRIADDCKRAFAHEADPKINVKRWAATETAKFVADVKHRTPDHWHHDGPVGINWDEVNMVMGGLRTAFQLYYRWRNNLAPPKKTIWGKGDAADKLISHLIRLYEGNWKRVAAICGYEHATKKQVIDRYKKNSNTVLRAGSFSRVEDALLLLSVERLKSQLEREGHFGELIAYLPWRFETVWRDRAGNLFADWIVPWKIEEDKKLLELADSMKRNWRKIADSFTSFKNRKGCLTRWKILQRRLKNCKGVEEYHEAYSMIRYNVFQYKHLREVCNLLKGAYKAPTTKSPGIITSAPPSEETLQNFLLSFDRSIMGSTIKALEKYIQGRDAYWQEWVKKHGTRKKTFDRRTFHRDNPQSMASALHIRGIKLKPKSSTELNNYETEVYMHYARFCKTKALKEGASRPYLPEASELIGLEEIQNIVDVEPEKILKARKSAPTSKGKARGNGKGKAKATKKVKVAKEKLAKPKVAKLAKPKAAKLAKPKAAKSTKPKASRLVKPKGAKSAKPKAAKSAKPKAASRQSQRQRRQ